MAMQNTSRAGVAVALLLAALAMVALGATIAGCSGSGSSGGTGLLFVSQMTAATVFDFAAAVSGDRPPAAILAGSNTKIQRLSRCSSLVNEAADELYMGDSQADAVLVFGPASGVGGNMAPLRTLSGAATRLDVPAGIALDSGRDILYVADNALGAILVWSGASTASGNVAPARTITGLSDCRGIALDAASDRLYVALPDEVVALEGIHAANGQAAPSRRIKGADTLLDDPCGLALDTARDRLYVANRGGAGVLVFTSLATATGNVAPFHRLVGPNTGLTTPLDLALDRERDHLHVINDGASAVMVWHVASAVSGDMAPSRIITGPSTGLSSTRAVSFAPGS